MRLDGKDSFLHEEDAVFCYHPVNVWRWGRNMHSTLYYNYHADTRENRLDALAEREPELAVAVECVKVMGLFEDCVELSLLRALRDNCPDEEVQYYREYAPKIVSLLRGQDERLKELYFTFVLPIVAAIDADESQIACRICRSGMVRLVNETYIK